MFLPRSAATIPVGDRGFVFGDGVYEVWRVVNGRLFESDRHLARLAFGLGELKIARPEILNGAKLTALADRLRTALLNSVSHDLRTPLASIKASASSLLDREIRRPGALEDLHDVLRRATRGKGAGLALGRPGARAAPGC